MPKVSVCMATRNGEQYIHAQLESILLQLAPDDEVIISDDSSTDRTVDIVKGFGDARVRLYENNTFFNPIANFANALGKAGGDYMALADQDDVWLPRKIRLTLAKMNELEGMYGKETPLLVHTDLKVVTANLEVVAESLWRFQKTDPQKGVSLNRLLVQNTVSGCTIMMNRALRDIALPIPPEAVMHDWWLALVAAAFGRIGHVSEPTMLYRQHGENDVGARQWSLFNLFRLVSELGNSKRDIVRIRKQAGVFLQRYSKLLSARNREMTGIYSRLGEQGCLMKRYYILKYGFFHTGLVRNVGMLLIC
ncbi:MAG: family 2 glycosyl [Geobacteraceae bacterium]|nr:MAG: family 2 glycosyl [Geobacteraceae bacterium]